MLYEIDENDFIKKPTVLLILFINLHAVGRDLRIPLIWDRNFLSNLVGTDFVPSK